jgi:phosphonate transport system substrate-binding protein
MTALRDGVRHASFSWWTLLSAARGRVRQRARRLLREATALVLICAAMFALLLWARIPLAADDVPSRPIRFGTTAVILEDQVAILRSWKGYLEERLGRPVRFVHRGSYQEITELLSKDQLDFAWVCGYPYVRNRSFMRLLAIPLYQGRPLYQSYLIVPKSDTTTRSFRDLKGKIFAYSDPNSNSGFLVPSYELVRLGENPSVFFQKSFFTWAHSKVVNAVAAGLANGGAVDGYVWETLQQTHPDLTAQTRVVRKSALYGFPPLVARASMGERDFRAMQDVLLGMIQDARGRQLLARLNLDGFAPDDPHVFDGIAEILAYVQARQPGLVGSGVAANTIRVPRPEAN